MQPKASTEHTQSSLNIIKRRGLILTSDILKVMRGEAAALHVQNAASRETCDQIVQNFDNNNGIMDRQDGVPGKYIGSSHFKKSAERYYLESESNRHHIQALLGDVVDPLRAIFGLLSSKLEEDGGALKLASSEQGRANYCRALCWTGTGRYALKPHDDVAQVEHAGEDYEITEAAKHEVVAVNFYPSMPQHGGDLRIWNYKPTREEKAQAGLERTGYPYCEAMLVDKEYWDLGVNAGDLLLLNGGYVHGVTRQSENGRRILLHAFLGYVNDNDAVWWT